MHLHAITNCENKEERKLDFENAERFLLSSILYFLKT